MELLGLLEISLLDLALSSGLLQVKQGVEVDPCRSQVFLLCLSQ